jgi:hypothetical protein
MADVQISEVDAKFVPVNVKALSNKFGNHGNLTIFV